MEKKVVVITGAGSGLGASLARKFSELGYFVCLLGRTKMKLVQTAETLENEHQIYELDVASKNEVSQIVQEIKKNVGPIDILINNAGVGSFDLTENIAEEAVHQMIDINLKGTIFCTQEILPDMKDRGNGLIVNVISTAGIDGKVTESVYCASKFGVRGFTESLVVELKDSPVKVVAAYMGGMKTDFWDGIHAEADIQDLMDPDDVADVILGNIQQRKGLNVTQVLIRNKKSQGIMF